MKKQRKVSMTLLTIALACGSMPITAAAGWTESDGQWSYTDSQGNLLTSAWKLSDGTKYYLDMDGMMRTNSFVDSGDSFCYVDETGAMVTDRWIYGNADSNNSEDAWYYFGSNGKAYRKNGSDFKKRIGDKNYIFDEDGRMLTGWIGKDGNSLEDADDAFVGAVFFAGDDGELYSGQWLEFGSGGGSELSSELAGRNYEDYDQLWLYFGSDCRKISSSGDRLVQKHINGEIYGFDENGVMASWWSKVQIATPTDGTPNVGDGSQNREERYAVTPSRYYSGYDGGQVIKDTWLWSQPSENLDPNDYENGEYSWWRTDGQGKAYTDRIAFVNGRRYAFDGIGRMRTGFVLFDGRSRFVAQYEVNAWGSKDFVDGEVPGIEGGDLYLFSPDELNDGSMQTGNEIRIELDDGIFTFGFGSDGKAFGNRNELKKKNNSYYINGLRLDASEEFGYGVVQSADGTYSVVGVNGKIVKGSKKLIKDRDGNYLIILKDRFVACVNPDNAPKWYAGPEGTGYYYYDKDNKENPYAGGLIAGFETPTDLSGLPEESCLNF